MGRALWKEFYLNILSKLWCSSKILFKQLRWHGFYPLRKSLTYCQGKTADAMEKTKHMDFMPSGRRFKEHRAARWIKGWKGCKGLFLFLREHATVFYWGIFLFWHKTDLHGWRADGRARSHNLRSVHGNEEGKITFFNLIILKIKAIHQLEKKIKNDCSQGCTLWSCLPAWLPENKFSASMTTILTALRAEQSQ